MTATEDLLQPDGRLVVVTFHSLEDRMVKNFLHRCSGKRALEGNVSPNPTDAMSKDNATNVLPCHVATDRPVNQFDLKRAAHRQTSRRRRNHTEDDDQYQYVYSSSDHGVHAEDPSFQLLNKHVVQAPPEEVDINSRSRSAKLRAARRTPASPVRPFGSDQV